MDRKTSCRFVLKNMKTAIDIILKLKDNTAIKSKYLNGIYRQRNLQSPKYISKHLFYTRMSHVHVEWLASNGWKATVI